MKRCTLVLAVCSFFYLSSLNGQIASIPVNQDSKSQDTINLQNKQILTSDSFYNNNPFYSMEFDPSDKPLWHRNLVESGFKIYNPVFLKDRILLNDKKRLVIMDPSSGQFVWEYFFNRDLDNFVAEGDLLVFADSRNGPFGGTGWVHGFSISKKQEVWIQEQFHWKQILKCYDNHLYFYGEAGSIRSYSLEGKEEWFQRGKGGSLFFFNDYAVTVEHDKGNIYAFKRINGNLIWTINSGDPVAEAAFHDGILYLARRSYNISNLPGGNIYLKAFNLETGKSIWTFQIPSDDGWFREIIGGVVTDGNISIFNTNRRLIAINAKTGETLWIKNPEEKEKFLTSKPIIMNNKLFAVQTIKNKQSPLQYLDLVSGKELMRLEVPDEVIPPVKVVGNSLFVCFRHGDMMAYPLKNIPEIKLPSK